MGRSTPPGDVEQVEDLISTRPDPSPDPDPTDPTAVGPTASERTFVEAGDATSATSPPPPSTRHSTMELEVGTMVGEYRITATLGEGGMGEVYAAQHALIGKKAAIKLLRRNLCADQEAVGRFVQEARAVNQIGHPNIVDIFAFGATEDGRSYLVMELLDGESLWARLRKRPVIREELCYVGDAIARALGAAHTKGIIHRDLKPENVFLHQQEANERPIVKLLDFGVAKLTSDTNRMERTRTGTLMGTPQYIAPEQARGYEIDARADIYSFGVMLFEMATGKPPFYADNPMDMVGHHLYNVPPRASSVAPVPQVLDDLIDEMLSKEAANRPPLQRVRHVLAEVRRQPDLPLASPAPPARQPDAPTPMLAASQPAITESTRPQRRRGLLIALAGAALLGGGAFAVVRGLGGEPAARVDSAPPPNPGEPGSAVVPTPPTGAEPGSAAAADPEEGEIKIRLAPGTPPGVLHFDGQPLDLSNEWDLALPAGKHTFTLFRDGQQVWTDTVELVPGKNETLVVPSRAN